MTKTKIAIIGTNGIPSKYGGFETLVEYLAEFLSKQFDITVFCSSKISTKKLFEYKGCRLVYIHLKANGWQSIPYDIISLFRSYNKFDKILILGASGSIIMPLFKKYKSKFIFNFGGLDWERSKWSFFTRKFLKLSESMGIKNSAHLISDNIGIQEYIQKEYNRNSVLITYGGDQVYKVAPNSLDLVKYPFLKNSYAFSVSRIQPDNNIDLLLRSFNENSPFPFVLVGNWENSSYGLDTKRKYLNSSNIILLDAIYDQRELNLLRSNCKVYLHGHSAGGTNPALVEAMNLALPVFAYDCLFNRYTTNFKAEYFSSSDELSKRLLTISDNDLNMIGERMNSIAKELYQWEKIAKEYSKVINK
jgi:glycosyltransferase involved in cell wall biosynthesis